MPPGSRLGEMSRSPMSYPVRARQLFRCARTALKVCCVRRAFVEHRSEANDRRPSAATLCPYRDRRRARAGRPVPLVLIRESGPAIALTLLIAWCVAVSDATLQAAIYEPGNLISIR